MNDSDRFHHEVMAQLEIETAAVFPPIAMRDFDWQAYRRGAEPGDLVGYGPTEQDAINDLIEQEQAA